MSKKFDPSKMSHQMVVAGLVGMIDDDGLTFHEAMEVMEDIKREVFPALVEMSRENNSKRRQAQ